MSTAKAGIILRHIRKLATAQSQTRVPDRELLQRFITAADQSAFEELVRRHGSMVLHVCRRLLHHWHDAEDVFQATFLTLARKAAAIRKQQSVGCWLHGVAYYLSLQARAAAARRHAHERRLPDRPQADPLAEITVREAQALLDEELTRLPERYRAPLVLCYLENATRDEAAQQLGWSLATLKRRLGEGREILHGRLTRRGLSLSAGLFAAALTQNAAEGALPAALRASTAKAALRFAAGDTTAAGAVSAQVAHLVKGGLKAMVLTKLRVTAALLLALGAALNVAGLLAHRVLAAKQAEGAPVKPASVESPVPKSRAEKPQPADVKEANDAITYMGRVMDPEGKPFAGAKLYLSNMAKKGFSARIWATSDAEGRFRFTVAKSEFDRSSYYYDDPWKIAQVAAVASGYGPAWTEASEPSAARNLTLRLVRDDVPIVGRVLDLQARPIAGVTARVIEIRASPKEDLTAWLEAATAKKDGTYSLESQFLARRLWPEVTNLVQALNTGPDGRFRLTGIGRDRVVTLLLQGPTIQWKEVRVVTRPGVNFQLPEFERDPKLGVMNHYGPTFDHAAAPTKPIVGVVRDQDTGQPLGGVTIQSYKFAGNPMHGLSFVRTTTDAQGHYRLIGMPKGEANKVMAIPSIQQPYFPVLKEIDDSSGLEPVAADFLLKRGIWVRGKVTDKATGKPVKAHVEYAAFRDNPRSNAVVEISPSPFYNRFRTNEDGSFQVLGLPGPGLVAVLAVGNPYMTADQRDDGEHGPFYDDAVPFVNASAFSAIARIDPPKDALSATCNLTVDPGRTLTGTVLGPDGKPLSGAISCGVKYAGYWNSEPLGASFTITAFNPRATRTLLFQHEGRRLAGKLEIKGKPQKPLTVRLEPWGTVTGRLVDADGQPRPSVKLYISFSDLRAESHPQTIRTDRDGKFRLEGLVPGMKYDLAVITVDVAGEVAKGISSRSGEDKDLGDVKEMRP